VATAKNLRIAVAKICRESNAIHT